MHCFRQKTQKPFSTVIKNISFMVITAVFVLTTAIGAEAAKLVWNSSSGDPDGYIVYWGETTSSMHHTVDVGNQTQYDLANLYLSPGDRVCFSVTAYDGSSESAPSSTICHDEPYPSSSGSIGSIETKIEAESYDGKSRRIYKQYCRDDGGGYNMGWIDPGEYLMFEDVDFDFGPQKFEARVASDNSGGDIEIRLDSQTGTRIGTCSVPGTNGWQNWTTVSCSLNSVSGDKDLYLVFKGSGGGLFNINWIKLTSN
jgi:hypothetical protein